MKNLLQELGTVPAQVKTTNQFNIHGSFFATLVDTVNQVFQVADMRVAEMNVKRISF